MTNHARSPRRIRKNRRKNFEFANNLRRLRPAGDMSVHIGKNVVGRRAYLPYMRNAYTLLA